MPGDEPIDRGIRDEAADRPRVAVVLGDTPDGAALSGRVAAAAAALGAEPVVLTGPPPPLLPDLVLVGAGGPATALDGLDRLRERARAAGARLPVIALAGPGDEVPPLSRGQGRTQLPDALADPALGEGSLAGRLAEALRAARRLEEACLRRTSLGPAGGVLDRGVPDRGEEPRSAQARPGPVLVLGDSRRLAAAAWTLGLPRSLSGALDAAACLAALERGPVAALVTDAPASRIDGLVAEIRRDPRRLHLPILVLSREREDAARALVDGASDAVLVAATAEDAAEAARRERLLARRLLVLLRAAARRRLADARLERFRAAIHDGARPLAAAHADAYRAELARALAARGRRPVEVPLASLGAQPPAIARANDGPFPVPARNPVLTTALAASREEDFVARVDGQGDVAILRDAAALAALRRRIAAIVRHTRFA